MTQSICQSLKCYTLCILRMSKMSSTVSDPDLILVCFSRSHMLLEALLARYQLYISCDLNIFAPIKMINGRSLLARMCEIGCLVMWCQIQVLFRHFNYTSETVNTLFLSNGTVCTSWESLMKLKVSVLNLFLTYFSRSDRSLIS